MQPGRCRLIRLQIVPFETGPALKGIMDAAEYKHVVLGLIFLKYISDAFEAKHMELETQKPRVTARASHDQRRYFWQVTSLYFE
jgi:type I restriction-modification system DNA methylase subunit